MDGTGLKPDKKAKKKLAKLMRSVLSRVVVRLGWLESEGLEKQSFNLPRFPHPTNILLPFPEPPRTPLLPQVPLSSPAEIGDIVGTGRGLETQPLPPMRSGRQK